MSPIPTYFADQQSQGFISSEHWNGYEGALMHAQTQPVFQQAPVFSEPDKAELGPCIGMQPIFFYVVPAQPQQQSDPAEVQGMSQITPAPVQFLFQSQQPSEMQCTPQMHQENMQMWQPYAAQTNPGFDPACQAHVVEDSQAQPSCVQPIKGNVWLLSKDKVRCRDVQEAFANATCDADRVELASEMRTHVWEALRCPHANFVLQKCIEVLRPQQAQFIITELCVAGVCKAAQHRYGCRVLQRLLEHCTSEQLQPLMEDLVLDASALSTHIYGHYVLQHLLQFGSDSQIQRICLVLIARISSVATDLYGAALVGTALSHAGPEERASLVSTLLSMPDVIARMASSRQGHLAAQQALVLADEAERQAALLELVDKEDSLRATRYGRVFARFMDKCRQGELSS